MSHQSTYTYEISQGATLVAPFSVVVNGKNADLSKANFLSTIKTSSNVPDDDPSVIKIDWSGGSNQNAITGGSNPSEITCWIVPADITQEMPPAMYQALIRSKNIPGLPAVFDLMSVILKINQPISSRF